MPDLDHVGDRMRTRGICVAGIEAWLAGRNVGPRRGSERNERIGRDGWDRRAGMLGRTGGAFWADAQPEWIRIRRTESRFDCFRYPSLLNHCLWTNGFPRHAFDSILVCRRPLFRLAGRFRGHFTASCNGIHASRDCRATGVGRIVESVAFVASGFAIDFGYRALCSPDASAPVLGSRHASQIDDVSGRIRNTASDEGRGDEGRGNDGFGAQDAGSITSSSATGA